MVSFDTDTSGNAITTVTSVDSVKRSEAQEQIVGAGESPYVDTNTNARYSEAPRVYRRKIKVEAGTEAPATLSVIYGDKRAQQELAFIEANRILEEQRSA